MSARSQLRRQGARTERTERGTALVEFAIVALLLFTLIFGVIGYGYLMSFRQALTQAAAEGARAGAVGDRADAVTAAEGAVDDALAGYGVDCAPPLLLRDGQPAGECDIPAVAPCPSNADRECVTVRLSYRYSDDPLLPSLPLLQLTLPDSIEFTAVSEVNP